MSIQLTISRRSAKSQCPFCLMKSTRATFYNRYSSPLELLIQVLHADLERCQHLKEARWAEDRHPAEQLVRLTISDVADHVDRFMAAYRHALHDPAGQGVYEALIRYFTDRSAAVIAQFFAHGFAGAIKAWLSDDSVTKTDLIEAALACAPAWWG